jgi:hypothetical protein
MRGTGNRWRRLPIDKANLAADVLDIEHASSRTQQARLHFESASAQLVCLHNADAVLAVGDFALSNFGLTLSGVWSLSRSTF